MKRRRPQKPNRLTTVNPRAAGIDIGSREHFVCAGEAVPVRHFSCFTPALRELSAWLRECGITTVAMEATGVYWIPLYQILEADGFEMVLVNAKMFKNAPSRKSDVRDCQWLQHLHECGLLTGSFRPDDAIVVLRSYQRQKDNLVQERARHLQRMQKALEQMNVQLHKVVSQIAGQTGLEIIRAIVAGERSAEKLADLRNYRVKRNRDDYVAALTGDYRKEHVFSLKQELEMYDYVQSKIADCDAVIELECETLDNAATDVDAIPPAKSKKHDTSLRRELYRITGTDLTAVDGLSPQAVLKLISEVGLDMSKWPTHKHFAAWLHLSPNNRITGGKVRSSKTLPARNHASAVFRKCAENLARSKSHLGSFYRRKRAQHGGGYAVVATAHKLARIFYSLLKSKASYTPRSAEEYDRNYRQRLLARATKQVRAAGFTVSPPKVVHAVR
jgi:transposase